MPKKAASTKPKTTRATSREETKPDPQGAIAAEIQRLSDTYGISKELLENFARFVVRQLQPPPRLSVKELQKAIYNHFGVKNAAELRKSASFKLATSGMGKLSLSNIDDLERIYRQHIGILPNEEGEEGYGCINGINIFKSGRRPGSRGCSGLKRLPVPAGGSSAPHGLAKSGWAPGLA